MSQNQSAFCPTDSVGVSKTQFPDDSRLTQSLEKYLAALEAGQLPDRNQYLEYYPDRADILCDHLDGLEFMHRTAAHLHAGSGSLDPQLEDNEILREVGRGGMDIVYETVQRSLLADALSLLPEDYREVLILRHLEGLTFPDVSQRMGRTLDSIKKLWTRALECLRRSLKGVP